MTKKAFIIGCNTHGLQYAESDAALMEECLEIHNYDIQTSKSSEKWGILQEIEDFTNKCNKTDTCIFYFSGHGVISRGKLQLLLYNDHKMNFNFITSLFEECNALSKLIILDCCHAGITHEEWNPHLSDIYRLYTASERLEKSKELDKLKASCFTYYIHQALMHFCHEVADSDNVVRINDLSSWIEQQIQQHNSKPNAIQAPIPNLLGNQKHNFEIAMALPKISNKSFENHDPKNISTPEVIFVNDLLSAQDFQPRAEFEVLCDWWRNNGQGVCTLVGMGGAGKTAIVVQFLSLLRGVVDGSPKQDKTLLSPNRVFVFSFYIQPDADVFFTMLYCWLMKQTYESRKMTPPTYCELIYELQQVDFQRSGDLLIILDGLERIQSYDSEHCFGDVENDNLQNFIMRVANSSLNKIKIIITTRFPIALLQEKKYDNYFLIEVADLHLDAAICLLKNRGVKGNKSQLEEIVHKCGYHALTIDIVSGYIVEFNEGEFFTLNKSLSIKELNKEICEEYDDKKRHLLKQQIRLAKIGELYRKTLQEKDPLALAILQRVCFSYKGVSSKGIEARLGEEHEHKKRDLILQLIRYHEKSASDISTEELERINSYCISKLGISSKNLYNQIVIKKTGPTLEEDTNKKNEKNVASSEKIFDETRLGQIMTDCNYSWPISFFSHQFSILEKKLQWLRKLRLIQTTCREHSNRQPQYVVDSSIEIDEDTQKKVDDQRYIAHIAIRDPFIIGMPPDLTKIVRDAAMEFISKNYGKSHIDILKDSLTGKPIHYPSNPDIIDDIEEYIYYITNSGKIKEAWEIYWYKLGGFSHLSSKLFLLKRGYNICKMLIKHLTQDQNITELCYEYGKYLQIFDLPQKAIQYYEIALKTYQIHEDYESTSDVCHKLSEAYLLSGNLTKSSELIDKSIALRHQKSMRLRYTTEDSRSFTPSIPTRVQTLSNYISFLKGDTEKIDSFSDINEIEQGLMSIYMGRFNTLSKACEQCIENTQEPKLKETADLFPQWLLLYSKVLTKLEQLELAREYARRAGKIIRQSDMNHLLCILVLVEAKINVTEYITENSNETLLTRATQCIEEGLLTSVQYCYGITILDLATEYSYLQIISGNYLQAFQSAIVAVYGSNYPCEYETLPILNMTQIDNKFNNINCNQLVQTITVGSKECGYIWGEIKGRLLLAVALFLHIGQACNIQDISLDMKKTIPDEYTFQYNYAVLETVKSEEIRERIKAPNMVDILSNINKVSHKKNKLKLNILKET